MMSDGLDFSKVKYKIPVDFSGLGKELSDVDAEHIGSKDYYRIEEKAFWANDGREEQMKERTNRFIDWLPVPAIVFYTSSQRDHLAKGDAVVQLERSIILDWHCNRRGFADATIRDVPIYFLLHGRQIKEGIELWNQYVSKTGYFKPVDFVDFTGEL